MTDQYNRVKILDFLKAALRFWWLLIIMISLSVGSAYYLTKNVIKPVYRTQSKIFIGREDSSYTSLNLIDLQIGEQLVKDYTELVKTDRVLKEVIEKMELDLTPRALAAMIDVKNVDDSRFISIVLHHTDPELAMLLANQISDVLEDKAVEIVGAKNIQIVDYAMYPEKPVSPKMLLNVAIAAIVGLVVFLLVIIIRLAIASKIETKEDIAELCTYPVLGSVPKIKDNKYNKLAVKYDKDTHISEAFRMIRSNLHYLNTTANENKTLMFTSALSAEGKSTTVANLAVAFSLIGKKVLLIDCDMRRPKLYDIFRINGKIGLTNYLADGTDIETITQNIRDIEGLSIICSGPIPPNPSEMLSSERFADLINQSKELYDVILIDTPPVLVASDGLNLVNLVDGVVPIVAHRQSKKKDFIHLKESLLQIGYKIIGVILTKAPQNNMKYYKSS